ncbi:MAG: HEAT repeat domain-containing protein [Pirellulaceae bacterium]
MTLRKSTILPFLLVCFAATVVVGGAEPSSDAQALSRPPLKIPVGEDDLHARFDDIWREVERLRAADRIEEARRIAEAYRQLVEQANGKLLPLPDGEVELHVVGLYEGAVPGGRQGGQHPQGHAEVTVEFTGQPLVLALCAYEPVKWKVNVADGVDLRRVVLSGYHEQELELKGQSKDVVVTNETSNGAKRRFYVHDQQDAAHYETMLVRMNELTKLRPAAFQGSYRYEGKPILICETNVAWRRQLLATRLAPLHKSATKFERDNQRRRMQAVRFQAVHLTAKEGNDPFHGFQSELAQFTPSGPIAGTLRSLPARLNHVAVDPQGPTYYAIEGHQVVKVDLDADTTTKLSMDEKLPKLSWPCGLAFDTKRRRLVLVSLGGEGFMYAYDVKQEEWSLVRSLENLDLMCLAYSPENDLLYGLQMNLDSNLVTLAPGGEKLAEVKLDQSVRFGTPNPFSHVQIASAGRHVVVLTPPQPDFNAEGFPKRVQTLLIDPANGKTLYRDVSRPHAGAQKFRPDELAELWEELPTADDNQAELLIWQMAAGGKQSVEFLRNKFTPLRQVDRERVAALIRQLDDDQFQVREQAYRQLAELGDVAAGELTQAAEKPNSNEQKFTIRRLLNAIESGAPISPELRRELLAIRVLGRCDAAEAVDLLEHLAKERPGAVRSRAAEEILQRIGER